MKFSRNLMTGLIGLALLAAPITAAAKDNDSGRNNSRQVQTESRSHESHPNAAAHNAAPAMHNDFREQRSPRVETRNVAPAPVIRNEAREQHEARSFNRGPTVVERHPVVVDRRPVVVDRDRDHDGDRWKHEGRDWDHDHDYSFYRGQDRDYAAGGWVMPRGYSGGACAWARHLRVVYNQDRYTGHPAAAEDLLPQLHRAERSCGGGRYGYNNYRY